VQVGSHQQHPELQAALYGGGGRAHQLGHCLNMTPATAPAGAAAVASLQPVRKQQKLPRCCKKFAAAVLFVAVRRVCMCVWLCVCGKPVYHVLGLVGILLPMLLLLAHQAVSGWGLCLALVCCGHSVPALAVALPLSRLCCTYASAGSHKSCIEVSQALYQLCTRCVVFQACVVLRFAQASALACPGCRLWPAGAGALWAW
jgi:hypothetical protein